MQSWFRQCALCFSAGSLGALAKSAAIWICTHFAMTSAFVSHLINAQYPAGIYVRIVWGGIAAFLFLLPLARGSLFIRGLLFGLISAAIQTIGLPLWEHGSPHLALVSLLSTLTLSCIWGVATALALRLFGA